MPLPRSVARFNRVVTNRILGPLTPYLPNFATLIHTGRKTHRRYRTPIMVFPRNGGFVIALTYGPDTDWVRNVLASGECWLDRKGRTLRLVDPRLVHDPRRRAMPPLVRLVLGLGGVNDFLELSLADSPAPRREANADRRHTPDPGVAVGQPREAAPRDDMAADTGA